LHLSLLLRDVVLFLAKTGRNNNITFYNELLRDYSVDINLSTIAVYLFKSIFFTKNTRMNL